MQNLLLGESSQHTGRGRGVVSVCLMMSQPGGGFSSGAGHSSHSHRAGIYRPAGRRTHSPGSVTLTAVTRALRVPRLRAGPRLAPRDPGPELECSQLLRVGAPDTRSGLDQGAGSRRLSPRECCDHSPRCQHQRSQSRALPGDCGQ